MNTNMKALRWESLRPYVTVVVLQCVAEDRGAAFVELESYLATHGRRRIGRDVDIVAISSSTDTAADYAGQFGLAQLGGFVRRLQHAPSWTLGPDSGFQDTVHDLTVVLRRGDLVAVRAEGDVEDRLQRWLDREPAPPFRRLHPAVLENALLLGQAKGLWLRGTHRRSSLRPDVKNYGGLRLEEAVNPWEDASFTMGSGKAVLADDAARVVLRGTVGTTPRRSSVWFKAAADFSIFVTAVLELFEVLELELATGTTESRALPFFARQVTDLTVVHGAYDISIMEPDLLGGMVSEDVYEAAAELENAVLIVRGGPSANFQLEVGLNGAVGGRLSASVSRANGKCKLVIGVDPDSTPTDSDAVSRVLHALRYPELISVYYQSGHAYVDRQVWTARIPKDPFPNWDFQDFSAFKIKQEKPATKSEGDDPLTKATQAIHDKIEAGGTSLFDWVAGHYKEGWLTCDDGPGELADFLHVSPAGVLSIIHVKGADSDSAKRQISAAAYEVVVGQAVKNLIFLADLDLLRLRLANPLIDKPATWTNGVSVPTRAEFLDAFDSRSVADPVMVVIVQPHVSEARYKSLRVDPLPTSPSADLMRLFRLETLLRSARTSAVGANADLTVIGSLS
ncbi:hypothetical protein ACFCV3_02085 [Kribbella sp. NPDC056345]|uniref:hypothetical protein n=1 Tax=Kribbella sp. NPDC056345 TaxID=3345789 RepID=UPI0035D76F68